MGKLIKTKFNKLLTKEKHAVWVFHSRSKYENSKPLLGFMNALDVYQIFFF